MKTILFFTMAIFCISQNFSQEYLSGVFGGFQYNHPSRRVYNDYLKEISTTYNLSKPLVANQSYGLNLGFFTKKDNIEIEAGFDINFSNNEATNTATKEGVEISNLDFDTFLGVNYFPNQSLMLGGQLVRHFNSNDIQPLSGGGGGISSGKDASYVFRVQAGVGKQLNDYGKSFIILPYYDFGITQYDFIRDDDDKYKYLTSYDGSRKTRYNAWGIILRIYTPFG